MLSIIIPSIRKDKWDFVLDSIKESCSSEYEVIFIGPYEGETKDNVKFIQDFASPNICQHKGILESHGDVLHIFSDDCLFEKGAIDRCLESIDNFDAVIANYNEGGNIAVGDFSLNACYGKTCTPDSFVIFNTAFMSRDKYFSLGGFDCRFETLCVAQADLAARWQFSEYTVKVENIRLSSCGHMPGTSGDHAPMHYAQLTSDIPYYLSKYKRIPSLIEDIDNWKLQSQTWNRRFYVN